MARQPLETPSALELRIAANRGLLPDCPFCGQHALMHCSVNHETMSGGTLYQAKIMCTNYRCNASVLQNARTLEEAQQMAMEQWAKRASTAAGQIKQPTQQPVRLRFPTMLRKMWSGGEVQAWLDEQGPLYATPPAQRSQRERELLEALEGCIEHMEWSTEPGKAACSAARTAIAKANAAPSAQEQAEHKAALEDIAAVLCQSPEWGADQLDEIVAILGREWIPVSEDEA